MSRRIGLDYRNGRRSIGGSSASSLAAAIRSIGDCDLWLDGDLGHTTADAVVLDPNNVSTANWTASGATTPDFQTIKDTLDGAPTVHSVCQSVTVINHEATYTVELKAGTLGFATIQGGASDNQVNIDLTTGALNTSGAGFKSATATNLGSGWWRVALTGVSAGTLLWIMTANAAGAAAHVYTGAGTGTILVRNVSVEQKQLGQWNDQSGQAHHVTQAVAANKRVVVTPSDGNGHKAVRFNGSTDVMSSANVDWTGVAGCTVFVVYKSVQAVGIFGHPVRKGEPGVSRGFEFQQRANQVAGAALDNATANYYGTPTASYTTPFGTPHIASMTIDPSQAAASEIAIWMNGFAQTMSAVSSADTTSIAGNTAYVVGGRAGGFHNGDVFEIIVFKKLLTTAQRRQIELLLASKYNILTDQRPMTAPTQYPGLAAWWKGSLGVTVRAPESFADTTGWSTTNTSVAGTTITGSNDGAPAQHWIQRATTGAQVGHYATLTLKLKAGVLGARAGNWARVDWGAATGLSAYVNLATGALGTLGAGTTLATITDAGDGWWLVTLGGIIAASTTLFIMLAEADNDVSYDGDGTETIQMSDITADQDLVSVWADQSGNGRNFLQAAAANQPDWGATYGPNNKPALKFDSVDDFMTAAWSLVQPAHVIFIGKMDTAAINPSFFDGGAGVGNRMRLYSTGVGPTYGGTYITSDGANNVLVVHDPESAFKFYSCRYNTTASRQKVTGVTAVAGNVGVNGGGGMRLNTFGSGGGPAGLTTPEIMLFSRPLSIAEEAVISVLTNAEYGVAA